MPEAPKKSPVKKCKYCGREIFWKLVWLDWRAMNKNGDFHSCRPSRAIRDQPTPWRKRHP